MLYCTDAYYIQYTVRYIPCIHSTIPSHLKLEVVSVSLTGMNLETTLLQFWEVGKYVIHILI